MHAVSIVNEKQSRLLSFLDRFQTDDPIIALCSNCVSHLKLSVSNAAKATAAHGRSRACSAAAAALVAENYVPVGAASMSLFSHASRTQRIPQQAAAANSAGDGRKAAVARFTAREAVARRMRGGERVIAARRYCEGMQQRRHCSRRRRIGVQFCRRCNACE
jgi:hypothetical protein